MTHVTRLNKDGSENEDHGKGELDDHFGRIVLAVGQATCFAIDKIEGATPGDKIDYTLNCYANLIAINLFAMHGLDPDEHNEYLQTIVGGLIDKAVEHKPILRAMSGK